MSIEVELKRIADVLEKMVEVTQTPPSLNDVVMRNGTSAVPVTITAGPAPADPKVKKAAKPVVKKEAMPAHEKEYQALMHEAAIKITAFTDDSKETNALFAKLQAKFKAQFPAAEHVLGVGHKSYAAVCKLVDEFLTEEKIV